MIKARYSKHTLKFILPAGTSRGILKEKPAYYIELYNDYDPFVVGIGEVSLLPGLSSDDTPNFENNLKNIIDLINQGVFNFKVPLNQLPSIQFALETALADLDAKGSKILFPSRFTKGNDTIQINGLIWMGSQKSMLEQVNKKIEKDFNCIKLKIGSIDWKSELALIKAIRNNFTAKELEIRVDANGAFRPNNVTEPLKQLADLEVHSIEQPIMPAQLEEMAHLCRISPIPIALDEDLLAKYPVENKRRFLDIVTPQYLVLKPGLLGGFAACEEWIELANEKGIGWWVTSSLESNIGLSAIAQWTYCLRNEMPQGLGTGMLYHNNIPSPLAVIKNEMHYFPSKKWDLRLITESDKA